MKLFVYKTVTCEVIKVEFLSRDLVLNNSAIMVKWKCLKLLYSSKGMCGIESQFKKMIHLKYLFLKHLILFSRYSVGILVLHLTYYHLCSQVLTTTTFPFLAFFGFYNLYFFVFVLSTLKKKHFKNIFSIELILDLKVFCDYQINFGNTVSLNNSF